MVSDGDFLDGVLAKFVAVENVLTEKNLSSGSSTERVKFDKKSGVVALGGGSAGDRVGFGIGGRVGVRGEGRSGGSSGGGGGCARG